MYSFRYKFAFMALLAMVFISSCSSSGEEPGGNSSSSISSGFAFCVFVEQQICLPGPFVACPQGSLQSNVCPPSFQIPTQVVSSSSLEETSSSSGTKDPNQSSDSSDDSSSSVADGNSSSSEEADVSSSSLSGSDLSSSSSVTSQSSSSSVTSPPSSSSITSPPSSGSGSGEFEGNVFTDPRDGKKYSFGIFGTRVWMTENLNYSRNNTLGWCYGTGEVLGTAGADLPTCDNGFGRVYSHTTAIDGNSPRGLCPEGWHIPTEAAWRTTSSLNRIYAGNYNQNSLYPPLGWKARGDEGLYWTSSGNNYFTFTQRSPNNFQVNSNASAVDYFSIRCVADATQRCGTVDFNPVTHFCHSGIVYPRCNTLTYNPATHFCSGTTVYEKCSGVEYNPATHGCSAGVLVPRCGSTTYNEETHFCSGTTVYEKCNGIIFNPSTHRCSGGILQERCGTYWYDPATHYCSGSTVLEKAICNGVVYNPLTETCNNGIVEEKPYILFENFESADAVDRWSVISNPNLANYWMIGTATFSSGSRSAYITDNGSRNNYNIITTSASNFFHVVIFPSSTENFTLSFDWKGAGESGFDHMTVYLVPMVGGSITASAPPASSRVGASSYRGSSSWVRENISLPASTYSGNTYWLLFRWINDDSVGTQPPAAIDNVQIR